MKKIVLLFLITVIAVSLKAQSSVSEIADKMALKELVDIFSILADQKDASKQTLLFTEDASVDTYIDGKLVTSLKGREQIGDTFGNYLKTFKTVYHINGQQVVTLNKDKASGTSYCMVTLIKDSDGKMIKTSIGVIYQDEYVKIDEKWFINKRVSDFTWQDTADMN